MKSLPRSEPRFGVHWLTRGRLFRDDDHVRPTMAARHRDMRNHWLLYPSHMRGVHSRYINFLLDVPDLYYPIPPHIQARVGARPGWYPPVRMWFAPATKIVQLFK